MPWKKDKIVGQKAPLKLRDIWAIRVRLQLRSNLRFEGAARDEWSDLARPPQTQGLLD
ncbi:hypothetical protein [Xanthomonas sp. 3075]|uniref:hypothetical protein n=1 Tax=Xanthomonas sp. 3075 TaxID=3035315 RepID=UPI0017CB33D5|nr:hypothetical protein [Xanthomonas sp. 3075]MBB4132054.1 hypothetical protein [Xanthomonas sp. 3075]